MKPRAFFVLLAACILCVTCLEAQAAESTSPPAAIGRRVPDFVLPDASGKPVAMSDFGEARTLVLVFMGTECPIGNAYVPVLNALQQRYQSEGVQVVGINSNLSDSAESVARHIEEFQVEFPVLVDDAQIVADLIGASRTPEVFVLDRRRHIRYRGRIDDRFGYTYKRADAREADLENALQYMLAGKAVKVAEVEPEGCLITRRERLKDKSEITFSKHISRILENRCAECHHPGTAAPFSLLSYDDAANWAEMIKETVVQRRMPPWDADPRYGEFSNDLRLTTEEIDTLVAWIDNGKPEGDRRDLPEPATFAPGWTIPQPDVVLQMPEEFTVQATGTVDYQYFVTPTNFEEDVWVQASEARPGNRAVVHHIIAYVRKKEDKENTRISRMPAVGGFAPGEEPMIYPDGVGFRVPAGADIVWQVHYTPTGKVETDRSELGLVLCQEPPARQARAGGAINTKFLIPAGAENHAVAASSRPFAKDVQLLSLMPHLHVRGKSFRYTAQYPDGREEILLNVPNYDFNWQHRYRFAEPLLLPKGTVLKCQAHYDNSAENPANPDPAKDVRWGDQTWEEMMIGFYSHVELDTADDNGSP